MPTNLPLEGSAHLEVVITNLGGAVNGEAQEVQITDTLPPGVELNPEVEAAKRVVANSEGPRRLKTLKVNPTTGKVDKPERARVLRAGTGPAGGVHDRADASPL